MRVTVYDIARELNIAQGTVSKALTNRPGVSEELRQKVLETAKRLGYRYNRNASSLARSSMKIGVTYPEVWQEYYSRIIKGIDEAITVLEDCNVSVVVKKFSSLYSGDEFSGIIDDFIAEGDVKGVLLFPSSILFDMEQYRKLERAGIPYVVVANELQQKNTIPSVHIDAEMSGRLAAEILSLALPAGAKCATVIATADNLEMLRKMEGFVKEIKARGLDFAGSYSSLDMPELSSWVAEKILAEHPDIAGIYVASGNSVGLCRCLWNKYRQNGVKVVCTDLFEDIVPYLENGTVISAIYQNPIKQGRTALMSLYDRIISTKELPVDITIPPYAVMKSNYLPFL